MDHDELLIDQLTPADPNIRDQLVALSQAENSAGYDTLVKTIEFKELKKALNEIVTTYIPLLYETCSALIKDMPKEASPARVETIVKKLSVPQGTLEMNQMKAKAIPLIQTLRWARIKLLDLATPKTVEQLQTLAKRCLPDDTTYGDIKEKRALTETMLLALPNIEQLTDQLIKDVTELLLTSPDNQELLAAYKLRVATDLYYFQIICEALLSAQKIEGSEDGVRINLDLALKLAPSLILPLAIARDELLKALTPPNQRQKLTLSLDPDTAIEPTLNATQNNQSNVLDIA